MTKKKFLLGLLLVPSLLLSACSFDLGPAFEKSDNYKNDSAAHYILPDDNTESFFVCDKLSQIRTGGCVNCTRISNPVC